MCYLHTVKNKCYASMHYILFALSSKCKYATNLKNRCYRMLMFKVIYDDLQSSECKSSCIKCQKKPVLKHVE